MNFFAWVQDWKASHIYPVYTKIRFILFPFFVMYECYKPNYFENWYITLSLAIKYAEQKKKKVALSEEEWWSIHQW